MLHVYEYETEEAARLDVARLGSRQKGAFNAAVYHRGHLIVVHFGRNANVRLALANVLGARLV